MTAKEYLNQAYWLDRRIDSKLEQLSALKDMATKTTSIMSDYAVQGISFEVSVARLSMAERKDIA